MGTLRFVLVLTSVPPGSMQEPGGTGLAKATVGSTGAQVTRALPHHVDAKASRLRRRVAAATTSEPLGVWGDQRPLAVNGTFPLVPGGGCPGLTPRSIRRPIPSRIVLPSR